MANQGISLRAAIQILVEEMSRHLDGHPEPEELLAYSARQLPDREADRLREHLSLCPGCCRLLLSLEGFSQPGQETEDLESVELEAAWQQFQERRRETWHPARVTFTRQTFRWWSAAASVLLALGLSLGAVALHERSRERTAATAQVFLVDLLPEGPRFRGVETDGVRVFTPAQRVVLQEDWR